MRTICTVLTALALLALAAPAAAQSDQRCFSETGQCIAGPIRAYWERGGGLPVFGFPITAQSQELVEGQPLQVQWFERDRLEIQADGAVTAGRLGTDGPCLHALCHPHDAGIPLWPASPHDGDH